MNQYANFGGYEITSVAGEEISLRHPSGLEHKTTFSQLAEEIKFLRTLHMKMDSVIEQRLNIIAAAYFQN